MENANKLTLFQLNYSQLLSYFKIQVNFYDKLFKEHINKIKRAIFIIICHKTFLNEMIEKKVLIILSQTFFTGL